MTHDSDNSNGRPAQPSKKSPPLRIVEEQPLPGPEWIVAPRWVRNDGGKGPKQKVLANALTALRCHSAWQGVLRYDALALRVEATLPPPWADCTVPWTPRPWEDLDDNLCAEWLQRKGVLVGVQIAATAVQTIARENSFHPVRDYLTRLQWDGKERLGTWLSDYMGADPSDYAATVGTRWMISAIARIMRPGCKVDCMLVFEGLQDQGKSTVLRKLSEPWFTDMIKDLNSKDTALSIAGKWIIEFQELEGFKGSTVEQLKAFLSRNEDRFRPPYGRTVIDSPRQCVFAGTTNQERYLQDETGNRRFWPVSCQRPVRPVELAAVRDQLWAEALMLFRRNEPWWLDTPELKALAAAEQDARFDADPWEEDVAVFLKDSKEVTTNGLLESIAEIPVSKATRKDQMRMGKILARMQWKRCRKLLPDGRKIYVYRPK